MYVRVMFGLLAVTVMGFGQWLHYPTEGVPRTADGTPNLTGPPPRLADEAPRDKQLARHRRREVRATVGDGRLNTSRHSLHEIVDHLSESILGSGRTLLLLRIVTVSDRKGIIVARPLIFLSAVVFELSGGWHTPLDERRAPHPHLKCRR